MSVEYHNSMHLSILILWKILPFFFQSSYAGVFHQLYSSTSIAGRTHGCVGELLTFTCSTSGNLIMWEITPIARANHEPLLFRFSRLDPVNKVLSNSRFDDATAILLENYNISSSESKFTSVVFIKLTNNSLPGNITCKSKNDNATRTLQYSIAETPQPPELTKITLLGIQSPEANNSESLLYRIQWAKPNNVESFDLDHYELVVGNHTMNLTVKVDAGEDAAVIVSLVMNKETAAVVAHIRAVDRCGVVSNHSSKPVPHLTNPSGLNSTSITRCSCKCVKEIASSVAVIVILIAILVSVMVVIKLNSSLCTNCKLQKKPKNVKILQDHQTATTSGTYIGTDDEEQNISNDLEAEEVAAGSDRRKPLPISKLKREDSANNGRPRSGSYTLLQNQDTSESAVMS